MDRYLEHFVTDETRARDVLAGLEQEYAETGMYPCAGGFVVWADRNTDVDSIAQGYEDSRESTDRCVW